MQRQLFSVSAIATQLKVAESVVTATATRLDLQYDLSLDGVWYFAQPAVDRIREALAA